MGVPRLDRYIRINYDKYITYLHPDDSRKYIRPDVLCLDTNPLIHAAAQRVFNYGGAKRRLNPYNNLSYQAKLGQTYKLYFELLKEVVKIAFPNKVLYIAIDGVAPVAKQIQQRQRRYRSASERPEDQTFDSNAISTGTLFMHNLMKYIHYHLRLEINNREFQGIQVIFSSQTVPGEGEHKIMDYIRTLPPEQSVCMFGPDGDLVMLGLSCFRDFYLLKENMYKPEEYYIIKMHSIQRHLIEDMGLSAFYSNSILQRGIYDFVFLGFLLGNDFLPKLAMFHLLEDGIEMFIKLYKRCMAPSHKFLINEDTSINKKNLHYFLKLIQRDECKYIQKQDSVRYQHPKFHNKTLSECMTRTKTQHRIVSTLNFGKYRSNIYRKKMPNVNIKQLCFDFFDGMKWIFDYYLFGCPSVEWFYPHHYPPFVVDLLSNLEEWEQPQFKKTIPHTPFEQLVAVLPPSSFDLLPSQFKQLLTQPALQEFFSTDIKIDFEGKRQDYQGIVLTSVVDFELLKKYIRKVKLLQVYARNDMGSDKLLWNDATYKSVYKSDYGSIKNCKVRMITLK